MGNELKRNESCIGNSLYKCVKSRMAVTYALVYLCLFNQDLISHYLQYFKNSIQLWKNCDLKNEIIRFFDCFHI